jgi:DNA-directed RNA polymerase specialized sigma24 family protein
MEKFPATRLSAVERIRTDDAEARRIAFGDLVDGYWKPVYKHLRLTWHLQPDDAQDLTQAFFADAFAKGWLERFDPSRTRFRTFVRVCVDRFAMNARQAEGRLKRGGGAPIVSLDFDGADRELAAVPTPASDPEASFHQEFIRALFDRIVTALRREYQGEERAAWFTLFDRYDLVHEPGLSYAQLARESGLTVTQVTNRLAQVRRRFRELALAELRTLCGSDVEFAREARALFGLEVV